MKADQQFFIHKVFGSARKFIGTLNKLCERMFKKHQMRGTPI